MLCQYYLTKKQIKILVIVKKEIKTKLVLLSLIEKKEKIYLAEIK